MCATCGLVSRSCQAALVYAVQVYILAGIRAQVKGDIIWRSKAYDWICQTMCCPCFTASPAQKIFNICYDTCLLGEEGGHFWVLRGMTGLPRQTLYFPHLKRKNATIFLFASVLPDFFFFFVFPLSMYLPFSPHQPNDNCMPAGGGGKKKGSCVVGEERGGWGGWKPDSPTRNDCFVQTGGIVPLRISWLLWEPLRRFSFVKVTENDPEPIPTHVVERMKHSILRRKLRKWRKYHAKKPMV